MATYEVWLTDDRGLRLAQLDDLLGLEASRAVNGLGAVTLTVRPGFREALLRRDFMIQVWRGPAAGRLRLWRVYFLRWWRYVLDGNGRELLTLGGFCVNDLLRRRIVAAYAGSGEAEKSDYADDMMKGVVREALLDSADPAPAAGTRVWSGLTVADDLSLGPAVSKGFAWKQLLTAAGGGVLAGIARAALEAGTEVFFEVQVGSVSTSEIGFVFRTMTGQPGADRTGETVFAVERGNLREPELLTDYREEVNFVYGAGQGLETDRTVAQVYDAARYGASIWNRCEGMADARDQELADGVTQAARELLQAGRGRVVFSGTPVDTAGTRFGVDWEFGDRVRAQYRGREFDAIVRGVVIALDGDGQETISARLDYEGAV